MVFLKFAAMGVAVAMIAAPGAVARDLVGSAQAVDGDSLVIGGREVRLEGIDAPEWDQPCQSANGESWMPGKEAAAWLTSVLSDKTVACKPGKSDRYGRVLATCYLDGINLNELMVRQGWAMAYRRYSDRYVGTEDEARHARRGMWRWMCESPEEWRRAKSGGGRNAE